MFVEYDKFYILLSFVTSYCFFGEVNDLIRWFPLNNNIIINIFFDLIIYYRGDDLMILFSNDSSYYSMIARLVLAEKNISYKMKKVDIHLKLEQFLPSYVQIQPNMTVPTLLDNGAICQSSQEILFFVNKKNLTNDLYPPEAQQDIQKSLDLHYAFSIEDLTMGNALRKSPIARFALSRGLARATRRCHQLMLSNPELKLACEQKIVQEEERRHSILSNANNYQQVVQQAINLCDLLEQQLSTHEYTASDSYSLADVVWTVFLARLHMIGFEKLVYERKNLALYWERVKARKSFTQADIWTKMPQKVILRLMFGLLFYR